MPDFLPTTDDRLLDWSRLFVNRVSQDPQMYGLLEAQCQDAMEKLQAYAEAYRITSDRSIKNRANTLQKNEARSALKQTLRALVAIVRAKGLSDAQRMGVGLRPRKAKAQPVKRPASRPWLQCLSADGPVVVVSLHDALSRRRGRPTGTIGAIIFCHVGPHEPHDPAQWSFKTMTSKRKVQLNFGPQIPRGATIWIKAAWLNTRLQRGRWSDSIQNVAGRGVPWGASAYADAA